MKGSKTSNQIIRFVSIEMQENKEFQVQNKLGLMILKTHSIFHIMTFLLAKLRILINYGLISIYSDFIFQNLYKKVHQEKKKISMQQRENLT